MRRSTLPEAFRTTRGKRRQHNRPQAFSDRFATRAVCAQRESRWAYVVEADPPAIDREGQLADVERPIAQQSPCDLRRRQQHRPSQNAIRRTPIAAIPGTAPPIAGEDELIAGKAVGSERDVRDRRAPVVAGEGEIRTRSRDRDAVDANAADADVDAIAGDRDHAFDDGRRARTPAPTQNLTRRGPRGEGGGCARDDDVTAPMRVNGTTM